MDQKGKPCDPLEHGGSFPVRTSQDAAVGALVLMLKKAPPLRQDSLMASKADIEEAVLKPDNQQQSQKGVCTNIQSSSLAMSRTTADALEELRSYKELKKLLLTQGKSSQVIDK